MGFRLFVLAIALAAAAGASAQNARQRINNEQYAELGQRADEAIKSGNFALAEDLARERLAAAGWQPEHRRGVAYSQLGNVLRLRGKYSDAEAILKQGLALAERTLGKDHLRTARLLLSLGEVYTVASRYGEAKAALEDGLARRLSVAAGGADVARGYIGLARVELALAHFAEADAFIEKARTAIQESESTPGVRDRRSQANRVATESLLYQGRLEEALKIAAGAVRNMERNDALERSPAVEWLNLQGLALFRLGRLQGAETAFTRAADIGSRVLGEEHLWTLRAVGGLAQIAAQRGRTAETEELLRRALRGGAEADASEQRARFEQAYGRFLVQRRRLPEAMAHYRAALDVIDRIFAQTQGLDEATREAFAERNASVYFEALQTLVRLNAEAPAAGHDREALSIVSRTQSRLFSEMLRKADAGRLMNDPAFRALRDRQATLKTRIADLRRARAAQGADQLDHDADEAEGRLEKDPFVRKRIAAAQARLAEEQRGAERELATVEDELWKRYPRYMELAQPKPVTAELLQAKLLKPGETLVTYFLLPDLALVFVVSPQKFRLIPVPSPRGEIAELVAAARNLDAGSGDIVDSLGKLDPAVLHKLYALLFEPVEAELAPGARLLVVGDGPLHTLPLEMLVTRWNDDDKRAFAAARAEKKLPLAEYGGLAWLGAKHQFSYLPSLSSLASVRLYRKAAVRYERELVSFADPVFDSPAAPSRTMLAAISRSARPSSKQQIEIARLPETADEAREIASIVGGKNDLFLRERAQERTAKTLDLRGTRYLHFATHGLLGGEFSEVRAAYAAERQSAGGQRNLAVAAASGEELPELSADDAPRASSDRGQPALVLSLSGNLQGEDGLLTMGEIVESMDLNARLVVLSACNTAGENAQASTGEGFAGLTRAFMYAGAHALVVSHWAVESQSAKDLMVEMFKGMRAGTDGSAALAQARDTVRGGTLQGQLSRAHPYFWAPFVYVGD